MAPNDSPLIRVTVEDIEAASAIESQGSTTITPSNPGGGLASGAQRNYGNINTEEGAGPAIAEQRGSLFLQGWFYLGGAGLVGALLGWGICEPFFTDGASRTWGNTWLFPLVILLMLTGFATAESIAERSLQKAWKRFLMVIPLGLVFGFIFDGIANLVYTIALRIFHQLLGTMTFHNPAWWIARGIGWAVFGVAGGLVYGIVGQSSKKVKYGILGGMVGAGLGGILFDPVSMAVHNGALSRALGFGLFGLATGAAMGFVESALKDRWLYVSAGPLAGKQFILYKPQTTIGSQQQCDIYLFKDTSVLPQHAFIELRGTQVHFRSAVPVYISGMPTQSRVLQSGDVVQIGRYSFKYNERHRA